jgi:hypothetical protein
LSLSLFVDPDAIAIDIAIAVALERIANCEIAVAIEFILL